MMEIICGGITVLLALWYVVESIRVRRQSFRRAIRRVEQEVAATRPPGDPALVRMWTVRPLSEHMVKRMAELSGFRFIGKQTHNGIPALAFAPPKDSRKLSIHD
ncbi:hypothetical protein [Saccharomonospora iraqiensis]|uniref:hypothetical protein n=1 Tax=Saccharomonospora iraqiensis TaxID=52698 RepID=UPI00022E82D0|nr:hypothetical protein [Saccharomonospora iraqiensis]